MSVNIYNPITGKWEQTSSRLAGQIKVLDIDGNYESENVEGCLKELKTELIDVKNDIKYIYENGTIGGGGGGGSSLPTVKLESDSEVICSTDEKIDIYYHFTSPNVGNGTAYLSINNVSTELDIKQGKNKWTVGPFERGEHKLDIYVIDKAGLFSNSVSIKIISGAIEITSDFDANIDYSLSDSIVLDYHITSITPDDVSVDLTLDGSTQTVKGIIGNNKWNIGRLTSLGVHKVSLKAYNETLESNILNYNIVVADSDSLFMSTTFNKDIIEVGKRIVIDYRISMKGETRFKTYMYVDDVLVNTVNSKSNDNYWDVGTDLPIGIHKLSLISKTQDEQYTSNRIDIGIEIVSNDFIPMRPVTKGLLASFDANGKQNESLNRNVWEDLSGNGVTCNLYNFNYSTNGWIDNALKFNGKTYAVVDLKPLAENVLGGFSLDVYYKIENVGDIDAKVLDCKQIETPFQGFSIDTMRATLSSVDSKIITSDFQEGQWVRQTYVIDRENRLMFIYTNGIISKVAFMGSNESFWVDKKLILGASYDINGQPEHFSSSSIRSLRIYNRPLTREEVLQNHIADIRDKDEQLAIRELNFGEEGLPTMQFEGDINNMSDLVSVPLRITYIDPKDPTKNFQKDNCIVNWQGTSSLKYPTKNYTIKLRDGGNDWLDYAPKDDWMPEARYTLKADFMETSHANNVGTAKYVREFFKQYPNPAQIKNPKVKCAIDGFPIQLYINGIYKGIYNFNIDRYAHNNFGYLGESNCVAYEIGVNSELGAGAFADDSWESIRSEFEYRYHYSGGEDVVTEIGSDGLRVLKEGYHNELIELVKWVKNCTDAEFRSEFEEHFSKRHTIDYFLIVYTLGLVDSLGKNMVLSTWGRNEEGNMIWYPGFYDMDSMLGLTNDGQMVYGPDIDMATGDYNTSKSFLWTKMQRVFKEEIADRYRQLRVREFTPEFLLSFYEGQIISKIGQKQYNDDAFCKYIDSDARSYAYCCNGTRLEFTRRWLEERFIYMDSVYEYGDYHKSIVLRTNVLGKVKLKLKTYSPQWIQISWSDNNANKDKVYVSKDRWYEFEGNIDNGMDNNLQITGATNIMYIEGIENLFVSNMLLSEAKKIVEVVCKGSPNLKRLELGDNYLLQKVDCSNCKNLGEKDEFKVLNLEKCINLKHLNCSNTKIGNVLFNESGGSLDYLNCENTQITSFKLYGQEYLNTVHLNGCRLLSVFELNNCNSLTRVEMTHSKLSVVSIIDCVKMDYLNISYTGYLTTLNLDGCPNLTTLLMSGVSNPAISELNLTRCTKVTTLDISKCDYLKGVWFAEGNKILTSFNAKESAITYFKFGRNATAPSYLDLTGFNLTSLDFNGCKSIQEIRGINLVATGSLSPFRGCNKLQKISGNVTLRGSISEAFMDCRELTQLPNLNLTEVTDAYNCFARCVNLTLNDLKTILSKVSEKLTSATYMFNGCTGIITSDTNKLPDNLFEKCTGLRSTYLFFNGCTGIKGQLPMNLLKPMVNLTSTQQMFNGCSGITGYIPPDFFKNNTKLTNVSNMFSGTKLSIMIDEELFKNNTELVNAPYFLNGTSITGEIPPNIFKGLTKLKDVEGFFNGCKILGTIPQDLFADNTELLNVKNFFRGVMGTIPENLLANCKKLQNVEGLFAGCDKLTGSIPPNLLKNNPLVLYARNLFSGCKGLGGQPGNIQEIPPDFLKGKYRLTDVSYMFNGCEGLVSSIPEGFLNDCTSLLKAAGLFKGCKQLSGSIPEDLFVMHDQNGNEVNPMLLEIQEIFSDCNNLTGYIPEYLFKGCLTVANMSGLFRNCYNLQGPIPEKLFDRCYEVTDLSQIFMRCVNLKERESILDETGNAIPKGLFSKCGELKNLSHAFYMGDIPSGINGPKLTGQLDPQMFMTNTKLENLDHMFYACGGLRGELSSTLFAFNGKLVNVKGLFRGCGGIESISPQLFSDVNNPDITGFDYTFSGCSKMTGMAPTIWQQFTSATRTSCFSGCTQLDNWDSIPDGWK